ncbi:MAG: N-acetyl-gamma-glutamyl-phosphate reductase [Bacteroidota bacterium]|nr:N-acetyl-gamma-glutamyl-phosphate reductase [Bacteroidota bacterium]
MNKIKVGIVGAAGYTGGELIRILINHPYAEISFVHSRSHANARVWEVHHDLLGDSDLIFTDQYTQECDVVFLCLGHGESEKIISDFHPSIKIIDLSQDFRIHRHTSRNFVYGLPELNRNKISTATNIANPGCFATAVQLALLPLAQENLLKGDIHISATTGSTGAGQALSETSHFSYRQNNLSVYKAFTHQHLDEINQSLNQLQNGFENKLIMVPMRGSFTRGILAAITLSTQGSLSILKEIFNKYYAFHPFVWISETNVDLKQVVNTNKCHLYLEKHNDQLMIISVIDNLLKGASGQAVQNMNLMYGLEETTGLKLKASAF